MDDIVIDKVTYEEDILNQNDIQRRFIKINENELPSTKSARKDLEGHIETFLKAGGKIQQIPTGVSATSLKDNRRINIISEDIKLENVCSLPNLYSSIREPKTRITTSQLINKREDGIDKIISKNYGIIGIERVKNSVTEYLGILIDMNILEGFNEIASESKELEYEKENFEAKVEFNGEKYHIKARGLSRNSLAEYLQNGRARTGEVIVSGKFTNTSTYKKGRALSEEKQKISNLSLKGKFINVKYLFIPNPTL